jgi:CRP-like cAMP-binding protein
MLMDPTLTQVTIQHYIDAYRMTEFLNTDLLRHLKLFRFPAYSNVFMEQDEMHYLYFLVEGRLQCNHYHLNGKLAVFAVAEPFQAIGDLEILEQETVRSNVIATEDTIMLGIERGIVERHGADDPRFLRFLIEQLRAKLYRSNALQMSQVLPVIHRLAVYLLAQVGEKGTQFTLPDKESLAALLGTTIRHLNRVLRELTAAGAIGGVYPALEIRDRTLLEHYAYAD